MVAMVLAVCAGVVALVGLTGNRTEPRTWMRTVLAGLPVVAVAGVGFAESGWNLTVALGMTLAVVLGMLASMVGPATTQGSDRVGAIWQATTTVVVGLVLGAAVIRWGTTLIAPTPLLDPRALALVLAVAAVAAAAGGAALRGIVSTGTVILLVLFALLLVVGVVAGVPATLTAPLLPVTTPMGAWSFLLLTFVLAAANPALRQIRAEGGSIIPGTIVLGVVMLLGLVALLSFLGGSVQLPSFGLATAAGYLGLRSPLPGSLVGVLFMLVVLAAAVVMFRSVFRSIQAFRAADADDSTTEADVWWRRGWVSTAAIGVVAVLISVDLVDLRAVLWATAAFAVSGWIVGLRSGRRADPSETTAEIDPVGVGQGRSG